jgi:hypothetical protein
MTLSLKPQEAFQERRANHCSRQTGAHEVSARLQHFARCSRGLWLNVEPCAMKSMTTIHKLLLPAVVAVVISTTIWYSGISLAWIIVVVAAWLMNGFIATYEDDIPGGFNNPDGTSTPAYVQTVGRLPGRRVRCCAVRLQSSYLPRLHKA